MMFVAILADDPGRVGKDKIANQCITVRKEDRDDLGRKSLCIC